MNFIRQIVLIIKFIFITVFLSTFTFSTLNYPQHNNNNNNNNNIHLLPSSNITKFKINLDLQPEKRWIEVVKFKKNIIKKFPEVVKQKVHNKSLLKFVEKIASLIDDWFLGEYGQEMKGIAKTSGIPLGDIVLVSLVPEFLGCSGSIIQDKNGSIFHGRNLDWGGTNNDINNPFFQNDLQMTELMQNATIMVDFYKNNKFLFSATTLSGYVGILTGMVPNKFSISSNWRTGHTFIDIINALFRGGHLRGFKMRESLTQGLNFDEVLHFFKKVHLVGPVYLAIAGSKFGEGAIIAHNGIGTLNISLLSEQLKIGKNYLFVANIDWWTEKAKSEIRYQSGLKYLSQLSSDEFNLDSLYFKVMSKFPILRKTTIYTTMMSPSKNLYYAYYWFGSDFKPFP